MRHGRYAQAGTIAPRGGSSAPSRSRRRSTAARAVGAVGMVALTAVLFWLLTDDSFRVTEAGVRFEGLRFADEAAVRAHLEGIDRGPNVFRVRASDIVRTVSEMPEVDAASAVVTLPGTVSVRLEEREPLFVWSDGAQAWLVDEAGMLFGPTSASEASDPADRATADGVSAGDDGATGEDGTGDEPNDAGADPLAAVRDLGLPLVRDERLPAEPPTVGSHLPASELAIMRQLLALTPELLGGRSEELELRVDEDLGYVLSSDRGWQAVFGRYSPRVQPPEHIPRQVQCLQALLAADERGLERVRLAISETGCGTFSRAD